MNHSDIENKYSKFMIAPLLFPYFPYLFIYLFILFHFILFIYFFLGGEGDHHREAGLLTW